MKKERQDPAHRDPVCGMLLSHKTAPVTTEYRGKTYYFCADVCKDRFEAEPECYVGDRQHG